MNNIANKLYEYRNNGEYSIAIFLDLSKAFNCVNHDILCMKLEKVGIMPQSHIPDYGSRLRSDSATTRKVKKSDYYPQ